MICDLICENLIQSCIFQILDYWNYYNLLGQVYALTKFPPHMLSVTFWVTAIQSSKDQFVRTIIDKVEICNLVFAMNTWWGIYSLHCLSSLHTREVSVDDVLSLHRCKQMSVIYLSHINIIVQRFSYSCWVGKEDQTSHFFLTKKSRIVNILLTVIYVRISTLILDTDISHNARE